MEIDARAKTLTLSVGEFSNFAPYSPKRPSNFTGIWRAHVGQQWHAKIQKRSEEQGEGFTNEAPIEGIIEWRGWKIRLNGRVDQLKSSAQQLHIREIKTVTQALPLPENLILRDYPNYVNQLLAYRELILARSPTAPLSQTLELYFVEIDSGLSQTLTLSAAHDTLLSDQLDLITDYLDAKVDRLSRLAQLGDVSAYEIPRPGQENIQQELQDATRQSPTIALEAPTGYGKTGVAWEYAFKQLAAGHIERVIYLTSKSTGQLEAVKRLDALLPHDSKAIYWQIRNKREHCIHHEFRCSPLTCPFLADLDEKWKTSGLQRLYLLNQHAIDLEDLKRESLSAAICPYETMKAALGFRDIWIGDYNYLFSPNSIGLLTEQPDYAPEKTLLILDEAHNLAPRVEDGLSIRFTTLDANFALSELDQVLASRRLRNHLKSLVSNLSRQGYAKELHEREVAEIIDDLLAIAESINSETLPYEKLSAETADFLWSIPKSIERWNANPERYHIWAPKDAILQFTCLDPSEHISQTLAPFKQTLFLSATLSPYPHFIRLAGLDTQLPAPPLLQPPASWLEGAYDLAIDTRVDTRYRQRDKHLDTTADTIAQLAQHATPTVAFFPSYAYANKVRDRLDSAYPQYRTTMQQSGGALKDRQQFLDHAVHYSDIILLVLGSSFTEGIDSLGGKIGFAIVVSPSLPEVNAAQNAKSQLAENKGDNGFEFAYLRPGMQKINQALGRLVRAPGQKAKVLLHCQRFAEKSTRALLSSHYANPTYILEDPDLKTWIQT